MIPTPSAIRTAASSAVRGSEPTPCLLHDFFDRAVQRWPDRVAIEVPPGIGRPRRIQVTYRDFDQRANGLGQFLTSKVRRPDETVALLLPRDSEHLYLSQLATLKAGAAYICMDPAFPDAQIRDILADGRPAVLLTDAQGRDRISALGLDDLPIENVRDQHFGRLASLASPGWLEPNHLAYIIYTSGTTGRRKGVMIEHASIVNLVQGDLQTVGVVPDDRIGQSSSAAYDSSVEEIWFALSAGATLVVMDEDTARMGPDLVSWLRRERVTMFCPPPTQLRAMACDDPRRELPDLRLLHVGGEKLPSDVAERWASACILVNDYGPTEATVTALRGVVELGGPVSIGRPVPGMHAWVLDERLEESRPGAHGELCLGGIALTRGYMNDPSLTSRKFPIHPRFGRIYRTGDLVHRDEEGNYFCHGRIDSQVKIRGYRIELEEIETRLSQQPSVLEAACVVQGDGVAQRLVGFVTARDPAAPPTGDQLRDALRGLLPDYMIPVRLDVVAELPRSVSGKLDRTRLPVLEAWTADRNESRTEPSDALEGRIAQAVRKCLDLPGLPSATDDFFRDLGGDSLQAALLISLLRNDPDTASLTVRDLYEGPNIADLAAVARRTDPAPEMPKQPPPNMPRQGNHLLATIVQAAWLLLMLFAGAPIAYGVAFHALPAFAASIGWTPLLLLSPVMLIGAIAAYGLGAVGLTVLLKRMLIGRYRPIRAPVWGGFYVRHWIVVQAAKLIPWSSIRGTFLEIAALRALGARLGQRVHIHRGVNLVQGGWDLFDVGDDVTLSQDAGIGLTEYENGYLVFGSVNLESGCTLEVRAGVGGDTHLGAGSMLAPLSFLPRGNSIPAGERWDGVPAQPAGLAPKKPAIDDPAAELSPVAFALALSLGRAAVSVFVNVPSALLMLALAGLAGVDGDDALQWLFDGSVGVAGVMLVLVASLAHVPLTLLFSALAARLMGPIRDGVASRWSITYIRITLKTSLVDSANAWLLGSLLWPRWLRLAGMKIGRGCEMSTVIDTVPELVDVGKGSFFADGIYLAGPRLHQGAVVLERTRIGQKVFLGNNALVAMGQTLPDGVLLGVSTAVADASLRLNSSWFGHPAFELPKREVVVCDSRLTDAPTWPRVLMRLFWELLRFTLPLMPLTLVLIWFKLLVAAQTSLSWPVVALVVAPMLSFGVLAALCLFGFALKWLLLGRVKPGVHPLYSSWCSRWEFHYIAWDLFVVGPLSALEGTLILNWFLRAMGVKIGRRVVLGAGFAGTIDHDMLTFEEGATVSCMFQAHTFEDRVLKIDRVRIRRNATVGSSAVLLYGADVGEGTRVVPHSVVMKHERLLPGKTYVGCPTREIAAG